MTDDTMVRTATPADEDGILTLCRMLHAENGQHALSEPKMRAMVARGINKSGGIVGVIGTPDDLKACIFIAIEPVWYSDEFQLMEIWNFVRADCRRSDFAKQLIGFGKKCSDETGLDLMIGIISNIRTEAKIALYRRHLPLAGAFFVYQANTPFRAERRHNDKRSPRLSRLGNRLASQSVQSGKASDMIGDASGL